MKKIYILEDLCCANCAAKIEKKVASLDGVSNAAVNFLTTKLIFEADEARVPELEPQIRKIVRKIEPDVVMREIL